MRLHAVELRLVELELTHALATAAGAHGRRPVVHVRVETDESVGEGECSALAAPTYTEEWARGAFAVLGDHLVPALLAGPRAGDVATLLGATAPIRGNPMARAGLEMALLDAALRAEGRSLADALGATRTEVAAGATVGIGTPAQVCDAVEAAREAGYERVKVKIAPGHGAAVLAAVRGEHADLALCADANGSFELQRDRAELEEIGEIGLLALEQPLAPDALGDHAKLVRAGLPVVLDESVRDRTDLERVLEAGAAIGVSIKPARLGGLLDAVALVQRVAAAGLSASLGGMLETGLGRAASLALGGRAEFDLPSDLGGSDRYFVPDLTEPHVLVDGMLAIPGGPGLGVACDPERLAAATVAYRRLSVGA